MCKTPFTPRRSFCYGVEMSEKSLSEVGVDVTDKIASLFKAARLPRGPHAACGGGEEGAPCSGVIYTCSSDDCTPSAEKTDPVGMGGAAGPTVHMIECLPACRSACLTLAKQRSLALDLQVGPRERGRGGGGGGGKGGGRQCRRHYVALGG